MMRPYMLWLAGEYGGELEPIRLREHGGAGALEDWFSHRQETRRLCDSARLRVRSLRHGETLLFDHKSKSIEILRRANASLGVPRRARGAVQGGR